MFSNSLCPYCCQFVTNQKGASANAEDKHQVGTQTHTVYCIVQALSVVLSVRLTDHNLVQC